jgi:rhamnogalacturonyl hydrolase YesR
MIIRADFVYMAPPFLAYYAADTYDADLLHLAVKQCGLYRQILQDNTTESYQGVWQHIIGPQSADLGLWSTGNAWAAAGMTRVLATVQKAPIAILSPWQEEAEKDLTKWIKEIVDGARGAPEDDGLLRNYLNDTETAHGFGEISGSTLLAATAYRMHVLAPDTFGDEYYDWAEAIRKKIGGVDADGNPHITKNGTATPAVNPLGWGDTEPWTAGSPEGNNFVVLMYTAWRDCIDAGKCPYPY